MNPQAAKEMSLAIVFTALYAVAVIVLAPVSFHIFQVRVADALLPLSVIFGWPAIVGVTVGAVVANFYGGLGIVDIAGGAAANFTATLLAWQIGRRKIKGSWAYAVAVEVLVVSLIVGSYLSILFEVPLAVGLFGVLIGSLVAIGLLGYTLLRTMSKPLMIKTLRSYGIKLYLKNED